jgi:mannose-6-phosphate isomerase-like protein (cupin superfamily)
MTTENLQRRGETPSKQKFTYSHYRDEDFLADGLRPFAKYRDFGFAKATDGLVQAHVLRFNRGYDPAISKRHFHTPQLQMLYLLKGWLKFEFEGTGEIVMKEGSAWIQPPGMKHTVLGASDDCEVIEITMPADYDTVDVA